jgi:4-hydroxybenzoate polyprenyltransferase
VRQDAGVPRFPALVRATHPAPAAAVTILAGAVIVARGADPRTSALAIGSILAGQLSVGWSNDYLDREADAAAGRSDKPVAAGEIGPRTVIAAAVVALIACILLSLAIGVWEAAVMAAAVASAWTYNALLKGTVLSWLPYVASFGLAPMYIWLVGGEDLPPAWVVAGASLLGVAGHLTNVLPDLEADRAAGARGLPHRLGPRVSLGLAALALGATVVLVAAFGRSRGVLVVSAAALAGALVVAVLVAGARGRMRGAFLLTIATAAAVVATFVLSSPQ